MSRSSFNDGVKIVPRYVMNLSQYEKNSNSLFSMSAVSLLLLLSFLVGGYTLLLLLSYLPSFLISPQWTVNLNQVKCDMMSFEASSMPFCDRNTYAASST